MRQVECDPHTQALLASFLHPSPPLKVDIRYAGFMESYSAFTLAGKWN
ncbi:MAG: hypothetical protein IH588_07140 [Anaerolineales bacterium]|nr:hypothetical protein [Anaerolineales bacterium]